MEGAATNDQRWAKLGDSYFARECGAARCLAILEGYKKVLHREPFSLSVSPVSVHPLTR